MMESSTDSNRLVVTAFLADDVPESDVDAQVRAIEVLCAELRAAAPGASVEQPYGSSDGYRGGDLQSVVVVMVDLSEALVVDVVSGLVVQWLRGSRFRRLREQRPDGENEISGSDPRPDDGGSGSDEPEETPGNDGGGGGDGSGNSPSTGSA